MMRPYLGELIGTFVLVFGGCGAAVLAGGHIGFAGVAAAFGLALLAMIYTVGPISGCHPNSAVKVLDGKIDDLLVIAEPRTLGELRKHYHKSLVAKLVGEIPKDLAGADSAAILRTVAAA